MFHLHHEKSDLRFEKHSIIPAYPVGIEGKTTPQVNTFVLNLPLGNQGLVALRETFSMPRQVYYPKKTFGV
jgi:hypothetical protein